MTISGRYYTLLELSRQSTSENDQKAVKGSASGITAEGHPVSEHWTREDLVTMMKREVDDDDNDDDNNDYEEDTGDKELAGENVKDEQ